MKGTKALVTILERKDADVRFGYPRGGVIPFCDEMYDANIGHVSGRCPFR